MNSQHTSQQLFKSLSENSANVGAGQQFVRATVPLENQSPVAWLAAQPFSGKLFIDDRQETQLAACGIADCIRQPGRTDIPKICEAIRQRLQNARTEVRYYGGFRFADRPSPDVCWQEFGSSFFFLPRFELMQTPRQGTLLSCNMVLDGNTKDEQLEQLRDDLDHLQLDCPPLDEDCPIPELTTETHTPAGSEWNDMVTAALREIAQTAIEKLVLARMTRWEFNEGIPPLCMFTRLCRQTPGCFHFFLQPGDRSAFMGATPEILYHRQDRQLETAAIAGTRPRGTDPESDARLASDLAGNDKERREHAFVSRAIQAALQPLCCQSDLESDVWILKLRNVQHLCQRFRAELSRDVDDASLLLALHPTPAVGGYPSESALRMLTDLEPFDRGWYAAPVGWLGKASAGFAVAIRSGLVTGKELRLYAGAGIVNGSLADQEWNELNSKIEGFRNAIR